MKTVQPGDTVTLSYSATLDNGETFATITPEEPLTVTLGKSEMPPTLENALVGMQEKESRKVRLPPEEGYGHRQKDLLQTINNKEFQAKIKPKAGMVLALSVTRDGQQVKVPATVIEVTATETLVDYNHPLAGHHLNYLVTLLNIVDHN